MTRSPRRRPNGGREVIWAWHQADKQGANVKHAAQPSQTHSRAIVWIDHLTAKVFAMGLTGVTPMIVHAHLESSHLHHKANTIGSGKVEEDPAFLVEISEALKNCDEVLIL